MIDDNAQVAARIHPYSYEGNFPLRDKTQIPLLWAEDDLSKQGLRIANVMRDYARSQSVFHTSNDAVFFNLGESQHLVDRIHEGVLTTKDEGLLLAMDYLLLLRSNESLSDHLRAIAEGSEFLEKLYEENKGSQVEKSVLNVVQTVFSWLSKKSYALLDFVLKSAQPSKLSTEAIVALLRTTGHSQTAIPSWGKFLNEARSELRGRDLEADKILSGL